MYKQYTAYYLRYNNSILPFLEEGLYKLYYYLLLATGTALLGSDLDLGTSLISKVSFL